MDEPRRPWLEAESLKRKYLALSAERHPDRVHAASEAEKRVAQERYTELNAAYNCLRDPKARLQHLLELELGAKPGQVQNIPPDLMNLFMHVGALGRETDAFLAQKAATASPLLQVQMFERGQEWSAKLSALQEQIWSREEEALGELKTLDAAWEASEKDGRRTGLKRLEELYRLLSFFGRWRAQIQERIVRLTL